MKNKYEGTQTEVNLRNAFALESQARNKYTYFASAAKKEGYEQISAIFLATADNEKEHAKLWFKELNGIGNTLTNLQTAADGEHHEWSQMYTSMAETAKMEGFIDLAETMYLIAEIERTHEERYLQLLSNLKTGTVFCKDGITIWICRNCGHLHYGQEAPLECPTCKHPRGFFEMHVVNY